MNHDETIVTPYIDLLVQLPAEHLGRRKPISDIMRELHTSGLLHNWAVSLGNRFPNPTAHEMWANEHDVEDLSQVIALAVLTRLQKLTDAEYQPLRGAMYPHLYQVGKSSVFRHRYSNATTGMSGSSGVMRRRTYLAKMRATLISEGHHEISDELLLERANAHYSDSVKDAARQGVVFSADDLNWQAPVELDPELDAGTSELTEPDLAIDMGHAVRGLSAWLSQKHPDSPELMSYANTWMGLVYEGSAPSHPAIAELLELDVAEVKRLADLFQLELGYFRARTVTADTYRVRAVGETTR